MVIRTVGDDHEPRVFSTWCAKAVAAIGRLPETVEDRAIVINMRRRTSEEPVDRLRPDRLGEGVDAIRRRSVRWASDHVRELQGTEPEPVPGLNDRAQDNWLPLLAIADACGPEWRQRARRAASDMAQGAEDDGAAVFLLADLAGIFAERGEAAVPTHELIQALHAMEERPWAEFRRGRPLSAPQMARMLKAFGARPRPFPGGKVRGYRLQDGLEEAFRRYIPQGYPLDPSRRHMEEVSAGQLVFSGEEHGVTQSTVVTGRESGSQPPDQGRGDDRDGVTGPSRVPGADGGPGR